MSDTRLVTRYRSVLADAFATDPQLIARRRLAEQFEADAETPEELALFDVPAPDEFVYDDPSEVPASLIDAERAATCPCGLCVSWRMGVAL